MLEKLERFRPPTVVWVGGWPLALASLTACVADLLWQKAWLAALATGLLTAGGGLYTLPSFLGHLRALRGERQRKRVAGKKLTAAKCGHETPYSGVIEAFGEKQEVALRPDATSVDYCLDCLGKMAIRCAWCGGSIFIGDPVTLYTPHQPRDTIQPDLPLGNVPLGFKKPAWAVVYQEHPLQLVGCLRMACADTGGDRAGFWVAGEDGKGRVRRVMSPIEQVMAGMASGKMDAIIVGDLGDMNEAASPPESAPSVVHARPV